MAWSAPFHAHSTWRLLQGAAVCRGRIPLLRAGSMFVLGAFLLGRILLFLKKTLPVYYRIPLWEPFFFYWELFLLLLGAFFHAPQFYSHLITIVILMKTMATPIERRESTTATPKKREIHYDTETNGGHRQQHWRPQPHPWSR